MLLTVSRPHRGSLLQFPLGEREDCAENMNVKMDWTNECEGDVYGIQIALLWNHSLIYCRVIIILNVMKTLIVCDKMQILAKYTYSYKYNECTVVRTIVNPGCVDCDPHFNPWTSLHFYSKKCIDTLIDVSCWNEFLHIGTLSVSSVCLGAPSERDPFNMHAFHRRHSF